MYPSQILTNDIYLPNSYITCSYMVDLKVINPVSSRQTVDQIIFINETDM